MCRAPTEIISIHKDEVSVGSRWKKTGFVVVCFLYYFFPWVQHTVRVQPPADWKVVSPASVMRLEILESKVERVRWKRDGGLSIVSSLHMRIHNDLFLPLKVRGINMTAALPILGTTGLYQAGYQHIMPFTAPPRGSTTMRATYVFTDLRLPMLLKLFKDLTLNSFTRIFSSRKAHLLESRSFGYVKLWPLGSVQLRCVLTAPFQNILQPLRVLNTCQGNIIS